MSRTTDRSGLDLPGGIRTSLRNNAMAYSYSVFITACFGLLATEVGSTSVLRVFAFLLGATTAFAIVETIASRGSATGSARNPATSSCSAPLSRCSRSPPLLPRRGVAR